MLGQRLLRTAEAGTIGFKQHHAGGSGAFINNKDLTAHGSNALIARPLALKMNTALLPNTKRLTLKAVMTEVIKTISITSI